MYVISITDGVNTGRERNRANFHPLWLSEEERGRKKKKKEEEEGKVVKGV